MEHIFNIMLFPFTSNSFFLVFPSCCALVSALFGLIFRVVRGDYRGVD